MTKNSILSITGFLLFVIGIVSLCLMLVGLRFQFLSPLFFAGSGVAAGLYILMIVAGILLTILTKRR